MTRPAAGPRDAARDPLGIVLRSALRIGLVVTIGLLVVGASVGGLVAGLPGALSAGSGAAVGAAFMGLTVVALLVAQRFGGGAPSSGRYLAGVGLAWFAKLIVFTVVLVVVGGQPWLEPRLFVAALVIAVAGSLIADIVAFQRARIPYVGFVPLPGDDTEHG